MLLAFIFVAFGAFNSVLSQTTCSRDRMRDCSDRLLRSIQKRINDLGRTEMSGHCMSVRDDFNCLLKQTLCLSSDSERNRNGDTLRNALKYLRDGCDINGGSWRDSSCYVGDGMKTCESSYPLGGTQYSSYNPETCRKFNLFQDCVKEALRSRCRPDDERLVGQYLVDTAQDLAWNCGDHSDGISSSSSSSISDRDRNRDDRYDRYDRNGGGSSSDRDRDRDRNRDSSSRDRDGSYSSRDSGYSRDRDGDRYSDRNYDRNGNGGSYDRDGGGSDTNCCRNERCSSSRMQQCRDSLSRAVDSRTPGYQDSNKCRQSRDDFNCLMWQTSNCMSRNERDRDNDLFRRARDFISRNCDTYGRWSENSCFKSTEMQRCESTLTNTRGGATYDSCRSYNSFHDCMQDELRRRCTRDDELYQGAYLADKAQELSWQCGEDQFNRNGRNQYNTENRRDPYDSSYNNNNNGNNGNNGYYDNPEHLEDDDAMCLSRIQTYTQECKKTLDDKRRNIYTAADYEDRQKINCCSARQYRSCLYDATKRVCQSERSRVVDSLMGRYGHDINSDSCRRLYDNDCDSANSYQISMMLLLFCAIVLPTFLHFHL